MIWRRSRPRSTKGVQAHFLLVIGRDPTAAEIAEFRQVIRSDEGMIVKDNAGNVLVDVRVEDRR